MASRSHPHTRSTAPAPTLWDRLVSWLFGHAQARVPGQCTGCGCAVRIDEAECLECVVNHMP